MAEIESGIGQHRQATASAGCDAIKTCVDRKGLSISGCIGFIEGVPPSVDVEKCLESIDSRGLGGDPGAEKCEKSL